MPYFRDDFDARNEFYAVRFSLLTSDLDLEYIFIAMASNESHENPSCNFEWIAQNAVKYT